MPHRIITLVSFLVGIFFSIFALAQEPDDCSLEFLGKARKAVKLRTQQDGANYENYNEGNAITVDEWHQLTCSADSQIPKKIPSASPIQGIETRTVVLRGHVMAARYETGKSGDHDFHVQIGANPDWNTPQVVVEIPPGPEYCDARKTLWQLVKDDAGDAYRPKRNKYILNHPPEALVQGYVFLDSPHAGHCRNLQEAFCNCNGGRGITDSDHTNQVQGIWEIHPVLAITPVPQ